MKTLKLLSLFLIITLLGCTEENYYTTAEGLGKVNVYIEGDITNEEAEAKLEEEIGTLTENIYIENTTQLNVINLDIPTSIRKISFSNNIALQQIAIQGHGSMPFCSMGTGSNVVESITINGITELQNLYIGGAENNATTFECNDLVKINTDFSFYFSNNQNNSLSLFDLEEVSPLQLNYSTWQGKFSIFNLPVLRVISDVDLNLTIDSLILPELEIATAITAGYYGYMGINNISFPSLNYSKSMHFRDDSKQVNINLPSLSYCLNYNTRIGLDSNGVNDLLNKFLSIQPTSGKNIFMEEDGYPSGQGLMDMQTLINQGNTVTIY